MSVLRSFKSLHIIPENRFIELFCILCILVPRYLIRMTDGTQFVVPCCGEWLLVIGGMTRRRCDLWNFSTLCRSSIAFQNCHAFPIVYIIVFPETYATVVTGTGQDRAHDVPTNAPNGAVMIVELSCGRYLESREPILCCIPEEIFSLVPKKHTKLCFLYKMIFLKVFKSKVIKKSQNCDLTNFSHEKWILLKYFECVDRSELTAWVSEWLFERLSLQWRVYASSCLN